MIKFLWRLLYPVVVCYAVRDVALLAVGALQPVYVTGIAALAAIPVFAWLLRADRRAAPAAAVQQRGPTGKQDIRMLPLAALASVGAAVGLQNLMSLTGLLPRSDSILMAAGLLPALLATALVVPVMEELLFRGLLYGRLREQFGFGQAMALSSLLFGLYHLNPVQALYGFLMGCLFCMVYRRCGSERDLRWPIFMHGAANGVVCLAGGLSVWQDRAFVTASAAVSLSVSLLCLYLLGKAGGERK